MIKRFDVEIKRNTVGEPLPAGGYVAKILNAKVETYTWGEVLVIGFDIAEGEYKNHFYAEYKINNNENKKWKGNYRLTIPDEKNQYFESQKRTFGNALACIEESNEGYRWDWNEKSLEDKMVGVLFRNYEYDINGRQGWSTECCALTTVDDIRNGNFKMPKDKPLKGKKETVADFVELPEDVELPFN